MAFKDFESKLAEAIENKKIMHTRYEPRSSKADVLDYYKAEYGKAGTRKAAEALQSLHIVKTKQGGEPKIESLMRRFQTRGGKSQAESSGVYLAMGMSLPPKPVQERVVPNTYTVTVKSEQGARDRSFGPVTFRGGAGQAFAANPTYQDFFDALGYPKDVVDRFDEGDEEDQSDVALAVTRVG